MESSNSGSWSKYDKLAGVLAVGLFAGYFVQPIEAAIIAVVSPLAMLLPFSLFIVTLVGSTGLYTAVLQTKLRDTERMELLRAKMKTRQGRVRTARKEGDEEQLDGLRTEQQELMRSQMEMMKGSVRPIIWSLLVTAPAFIWLRWVFTSRAVAVAPERFSFRCSEKSRGQRRLLGR
ncbi:DUF106 domain-containing protein [Haladaptatus sp. DFWS20]|uniref:DUF106 domain-containing protein n=1 Tax=Haladaptatus sp. DFWS20 TaxID=3403467 RepID=UPI003EBCFD1F